MLGTCSSGVPRNFVRWRGGGSTNSVDRGQRERGCGGGSPIVRGSGGSCGTRNLISYSKMFLIFGTLRLFIMPTNLFVIANVKQLRTYAVLEFYCPFSRPTLCVGVLNSALFNSFHNRVELGTILESLRNFGGGGGLSPPSPRYATAFLHPTF